MGIGSSTPPPPPPPSPQLSILNKPWREINWSDKQSALHNVNTYQPQAERQQLRILLHGPLASGKSSFINSVSSVLKGTMCTPALVANISEDCYTKKYTTYRIKKGNSFYPFVLCDMMGLRERSRRNRKIHVKDVKRLLKGHFNPECKLSKTDQFYNDAPTANDKVHVLVFVIDANRESLMKDEIVETILDIRDEASDLGIPQVVLFTKIDEVCPEIKQDVKNVYRSKMLQEKMHHFSAVVGIPINCIFAVKNYTNTNFNNDTDALLLNTLRHIIDFGDDFLNRMLSGQAGY